MKIISICNQKGGCAKTTTVINIAAELAQQGKKVLMIDNDYQANLSAAFAINQNEFSLYDCFSEEVELNQIIKKCEIIETLDIVPCNMNYANTELAFSDTQDNKNMLKKLLKKSKLNYDYIIIDCPPSLNLTVINSLVASDEILIPLEPSLFNFQGLSNLLKVIEMIQRSLNKKLTISGIVLTRVDSRTKLGNEFIEHINTLVPNKLLKTQIHQNTAIVRSQLYGLPVSIYEPRSRGAKEYKELVKEIFKDE